MNRKIAIVLVTALVCSVMWFSSRGKEIRTVKVIQPSFSDIINSVSATGSVEQIRTSNLYSKNYAAIERIYVNTGDSVKKDQVLMSLKEAEVQVPDTQELSGVVSEVFSRVTVDEIPIADYIEGNLIKSPFDGVVTEVCVNETQSISPVTKCIVVSDVSRTQAIVSVVESDIAKIKVGMPASITGNAFSGIFNGVVLEVAQQIKTSVNLTGTSDKYAKVVIELFDANKDLFPGSSVNAKIYTTQKKNVITLPYEAITQDSENKEVVFVINNGVVERRRIITGDELSNQIEIVRGISTNDTVILNPSDDLVIGEKVKEG